MSAQTNEKAFALVDVLALVTGTNISPRGIRGCMDIIDFMTGRVLMDAQGRRAADVCVPFILDELHPALKTVDITELDNKLASLRGEGAGDEVLRSACNAWVAEQKNKLEVGDSLIIRKLPPGTYKPREVGEELRETFPHAHVLIADETGKEVTTVKSKGAQKPSASLRGHRQKPGKPYVH